MHRALRQYFLAILLMLCTGAAVSSAPQFNGQVQVGFSPEGTARALVLNVIAAAEQELLLMGYSFTSPEIVKALIEAHRKGVEVKLVLDMEGNKNPANLRAIKLVRNAGISVRLNDSYQTQHDKVIIVEQELAESNWLPVTMKSKIAS